MISNKNLKIFYFCFFFDNYDYCINCFNKGNNYIKMFKLLKINEIQCQALFFLFTNLRLFHICCVFLLYLVLLCYNIIANKLTDYIYDAISIIVFN